MKIRLNDCDWCLQGWWPGVPIWSRDIPTIMGNPFLGVTETIKASVPGGVHHDLWKAGIIEDPYFDRNSVKCEWVENRWWNYTTSFHVAAKHEGRKLTLIFKGIDYKAHFYLNNSRLGEHCGQFDAAVFDVTDIIQSDRENVLEIIFENVPEEMSQIGYTSRTRTQKSRFAYKWDWSTRLVNIGLWDDVLLRVTGDLTIGDTHIATNVEDGNGIIRIRSNVEGGPGRRARIKIDISLAGETIYSAFSDIHVEQHEYSLEREISIRNPELWYPNGAGNQPLYKAKISLLIGNELSDEREYFIGIRKLGFRKNEDSPADALPYTILVNDTPIYAKAVNLSPWDQMYGNVTDETYERNVLLLKRANINLVRINGCGLIEKEIFYNLCDVHGIMIWQDFIQSSSGIDNVPSLIPEFLSLLKRSAEYSVKLRRNHVSMTIWCGGNELMDESSLSLNRSIPVGLDHPNIAMLKSIVEAHDSGKLFLPSSASGPNFGLDISSPGENHDVHGPHTYCGIKDHYRIYNNSDSLFHGELGVNGMSSVISLRKFLSPEDIRITSMNENLAWRHHGEWWDSLKRDENIFGKFSRLLDFIKASQFIQAEGLRYALEANRRRKFKNSGSSIWAFNEAFPNVANCAFVEYHGIPKMAYYWVRQAYAPLHASFKYDKLYYDPMEEIRLELFLHNSRARIRVNFSWEILDVSGKALERERSPIDVPANCAMQVKKIVLRIPQMPFGIFFVRLRLLGEEGQNFCENLYLFSQVHEKIFSSIFTIKGGQIEKRRDQSGYIIRNTGNKVCLFVHGMEESGDVSVFIRNNYTSLFPGEELLFSPELVDRAKEKNIDEIEIVWDYLNSSKEDAV